MYMVLRVEKNLEVLFWDYWRVLDVMLFDVEDIMIICILYIMIYLFLVVFEVIYMYNCLIKNGNFLKNINCVGNNENWIGFVFVVLILLIDK